MSNSAPRQRFGWLPDYPDLRDYSPEHELVAPALKKAGLGDPAKAVLPAAADLREWCPPVEDQGDLGSCTANAAVAMVEYFERRAYGKHLDASRLFLYKTTRNLLRWSGDTGAFLRTTMAALVLFGLPPEKYWPYQTDRYDEEPPAFCYAFAQNYQALSYYRLDPPGTSGAAVLKRLKTLLAAGFPAMFGFTVYSSIAQADRSGKIPFPMPGERVEGGHAVLAVGYDDSMKIRNAAPKSPQTKGALLIRNSWGEGWGDGGYGWLPYDYVLKGLAEDWWSLIKNEWIDTDAFQLAEDTTGK